SRSPLIGAGGIPHRALRTAPSPFRMPSDHAHATWHEFMLTASPDTGDENFVCHASARRPPSFTAPAARGARRSRRPRMRLSQMSSLTALALTAGLLSPGGRGAGTRKKE